MTYKKKTGYQHEALMRYGRQLGYGDFHVKFDQELGLHAIIAINSTKLGPAIGGCRCYEYNDGAAALKDVLHLAYMMTLKAAVTGLKHGGAKSAIIKPPHIENREAFFEGFGEFVEQMNGRYIAAVDVGTTPEDMEIIGRKTKHVVCEGYPGKGPTDPSPFTALGVIKGIQAAVKHKFNRDSLDGTHVAVQGAGRVAYSLIKQLSELGASITVADLKSENTDRCADEFSAKVVSVEDIYAVEADVFSPCAMSGALTLSTIDQIKAPIIAGAANSQLAHEKFGQLLHDRGVLYVPDYIINSGGLIWAAAIYDYQDESRSLPLIDNLYNVMLNIFERSDKEKTSTQKITEAIARENIAKGK